MQHPRAAAWGKKALSLLQNMLKSRKKKYTGIPGVSLLSSSQSLFSGVRRSWLADYLGDVWFHFSESFPIAVLYIFPVTVLILLFLCCFTYVCTLHTPRCSRSQCPLSQHRAAGRSCSLGSSCFLG